MWDEEGPECACAAYGEAPYILLLNEEKIKPKLNAKEGYNGDCGMLI
jgi:hypothetical protein